MSNNLCKDFCNLEIDEDFFNLIKSYQLKFYNNIILKDEILVTFPHIKRAKICTLNVSFKVALEVLDVTIK